MGVVSTILVIVSPTARYSLSSHFIDEHEGRTEVKASTGFNCSIELAGALSMRVMAPSGACMFL